MLHLLASVVEHMFPSPGVRVEERLHVFEEHAAVAGGRPAEVADLVRGDELGGGPGATPGGVDVNEARSGGPVGLTPAVRGDAPSGAGRVDGWVGKGLYGVDAREVGVLVDPVNDPGVGCRQGGLGGAEVVPETSVADLDEGGSPLRCRHWSARARR